MAIFMTAHRGAGIGSLSESTRDCSERIFQHVTSYCQEEGVDGLSAETLLATLAAVTGTMTRRAYNDLKKPEDTIVANEFFEGVSEVLLSVVTPKDSDTSAFPPFGDFFTHTLKNADYKNSIVLTNDAYYTPHEEPALSAAILRDDVIFLGEKYGLSEQSLATASLHALAQALHQVLQVVPADVAYKMAMETTVGIAYMEPLDRTKIQIPQKLHISERVVAAGSEITEILLKQSHALADGRSPHPPTMIAKAGALLGEMAHRAGIERDVTADYVSSAEVDTFLEDCNVQLMASFIRRGGNAKKLADYGEYAANAATSFGSTPYPKHNVKKKYLPHACPAAEAAMARDPARVVAKKYNLLDWEIATACMVAVNDLTRLTERVITTPVAVRLAMEEAAAIARVKPIDLDALTETMPEDIRNGMVAMRRKAAHAVSGKYSHSTDYILNQFLNG